MGENCSRNIQPQSSHSFPKHQAHIPINGHSQKWTSWLAECREFSKFFPSGFPLEHKCSSALSPSQRKPCTSLWNQTMSFRPGRNKTVTVRDWDNGQVQQCYHGQITQTPTLGLFWAPEQHCGAQSRIWALPEPTAGPHQTTTAQYFLLTEQTWSRIYHTLCPLSTTTCRKLFWSMVISL